MKKNQDLPYIPVRGTDMFFPIRNLKINFLVSRFWERGIRYKRGKFPHYDGSDRNEYLKALTTMTSRKNKDENSDKNAAQENLRSEIGDQMQAVMELMTKAQSNPRMMQIMQEVMSNPAAMKKYENDPE